MLKPNAYLVYSTAPQRAEDEPMIDIFIASDNDKAEGMFLSNFHNAVAKTTKSELIVSDVERAEGAVRFDLNDWLYWELLETVGSEKILRIMKDAYANTECS